QNMAGGAVVALQSDHPCPGKVLLEPQYVADLGDAQAVDRLVVVADAGDVLVTRGQQAEPQILRDVGILILVDEDRPKATLVVGEDVGMAGEEGEPVQEQIAEVTGVQGRETLLIGGVELDATSERELPDLRRRNLV